MPSAGDLELAREALPSKSTSAKVFPGRERGGPAGALPFVKKVLSRDDPLIEDHQHGDLLESGAVMRRMGDALRRVGEGFPKGHWAPVHEIDTDAAETWYVGARFDLNLRQLMRSRELDAVATWQIVDGIVEGLAVLGRVQGRAHGRICPENILFREKHPGHPYLSDPASTRQMERVAKTAQERLRIDLQDVGRILRYLCMREELRGDALLVTLDVAPFERIFGRDAADEWRSLCEGLLRATLRESTLTLDEVSRRLEALRPRGAPARARRSKALDAELSDAGPTAPKAIDRGAEASRAVPPAAGPSKPAPAAPITGPSQGVPPSSPAPTTPPIVAAPSRPPPPPPPPAPAAPSTITPPLTVTTRSTPPRTTTPSTPSTTTPSTTTTPTTTPPPPTTPAVVVSTPPPPIAEVPPPHPPPSVPAAKPPQAAVLTSTWRPLVDRSPPASSTPPIAAPPATSAAATPPPPPIGAVESSDSAAPVEPVANRRGRRPVAETPAAEPPVAEPGAAKPGAAEPAAAEPAVAKPAVAKPAAAEPPAGPTASAGDAPVTRGRSVGASATAALQRFAGAASSAARAIGTAGSSTIRGAGAMLRRVAPAAIATATGVRSSFLRAASWAGNGWTAIRRSWSSLSPATRWGGAGAVAVVALAIVGVNMVMGMPRIGQDDWNRLVAAPDWFWDEVGGSSAAGARPAANASVRQGVRNAIAAIGLGPGVAARLRSIRDTSNAAGGSAEPDPGYLAVARGSDLEIRATQLRDLGNAAIAARDDLAARAQVAREVAAITPALGFAQPTDPELIDLDPAILASATANGNALRRLHGMLATAPNAQQALVAAAVAEIVAPEPAFAAQVAKLGEHPALKALATKRRAPGEARPDPATIVADRLETAFALTRQDQAIQWLADHMNDYVAMPKLVNTLFGAATPPTIEPQIADAAAEELRAICVELGLTPPTPSPAATAEQQASELLRHVGEHLVAADQQAITGRAPAFKERLAVARRSATNRVATADLLRRYRVPPGLGDVDDAWSAFVGRQVDSGRSDIVEPRLQQLNAIAEALRAAKEAVESDDAAQLDTIAANRAKMLLSSIDEAELARTMEAVAAVAVAAREVKDRKDAMADRATDLGNLDDDLAELDRAVATADLAALGTLLQESPALKIAGPFLDELDKLNKARTALGLPDVDAATFTRVSQENLMRAKRIAACAEAAATQIQPLLDASSSNAAWFVVTDGPLSTADDPVAQAALVLRAEALSLADPPELTRGGPTDDALARRLACVEDRWALLKQIGQPPTGGGRPSNEMLFDSLAGLLAPSTEIAALPPPRWQEGLATIVDLFVREGLTSGQVAALLMSPGLTAGQVAERAERSANLRHDLLLHMLRLDNGQDSSTTQELLKALIATLGELNQGPDAAANTQRIEELRKVQAELERQGRPTPPDPKLPDPAVVAAIQAKFAGQPDWTYVRVDREGDDHIARLTFSGAFNGPPPNRVPLAFRSVNTGQTGQTFIMTTELPRSVFKSTLTGWVADNAPLARATPAVLAAIVPPGGVVRLPTLDEWRRLVGPESGGAIDRTAPNLRDQAFLEEASAAVQKLDSPWPAGSLPPPNAVVPNQYYSDRESSYVNPDGLESAVYLRDYRQNVGDAPRKRLAPTVDSTKDGTAFFRDVYVGAEPPPVFRDLIGNVAEVVVDGGQNKVVGGSAFARLERAEELKDYNASKLSDVGLRLAFDIAPSAPIAPTSQPAATDPIGQLRTSLASMPYVTISDRTSRPSTGAGGASPSPGSTGSATGGAPPPPS